ncbi:glycosyltransferase, partial [Tepidibacillus decaturensis]|uniref:glycosyltransferase n=1 Tax=Tepidibacillus decaturensis TaxID=1413211 RepID=UPI001F38280A
NRMQELVVNKSYNTEIIKNYINQTLQKEEEGIYSINRLSSITIANQRVSVEADFIKEMVNMIGEDNLTIFSYMPDYIRFLNKISKDIPIIYECVDEHTGFNHSYATKKLEEEMIQRSSVVITTADTLFTRKFKLNSRTYLVKNAVNPNYFSNETAIPKELSDIKRENKIIIGYLGAIANWFDKELLIEVAKKNEHMVFVLVGTIYIDVSDLKEVENIILLGTKAYDEVPSYLKAFDIGMIPFKMEDIIINCNPIKFYEYMAANLPTIATPIPELMEYHDGKMIILAKNADEFSDGINHLFNEKISLEYMKKIANENSWAERVEKIDQIIQGNLVPEHEQLLFRIENKYNKYRNIEIIDYLSLEIKALNNLNGVKEELIQLAKKSHSRYIKQQTAKLLIKNNNYEEGIIFLNPNESLSEWEIFKIYNNNNNRITNLIKAKLKRYVLEHEEARQILEDDNDIYSQVELATILMEYGDIKYALEKLLFLIKSEPSILKNSIVTNYYLTIYFLNKRNYKQAKLYWDRLFVLTGEHKETIKIYNFLKHGL